jgi:hypothetical protein
MRLFSTVTGIAVHETDPGRFPGLATAAIAAVAAATPSAGRVVRLGLAAPAAAADFPINPLADSRARA